ncbi:MAG: rod shape-determining protein MreC [Eubacteriales bacterium]|nr:rod shape-determining protein MreC [Eubacteriales bacterium]
MRDKFTKPIFIFLTSLCVFAIVFSFIMPNIFNPVRNVVNSVLVPIQSSVNSFGTYVIQKVSEKKDLVVANATIEALNIELNEKIEENNRLKAETYELERLRNLYELDQDYLQYKKVAARVIAKDSEEWFQVFRINKGKNDGIRVDMNVISGGGLLGIVTDVGLNYATVRSIIDDESRVTAMTQHSGATCIVEGDVSLFNTDRIKLTHIDIQSIIVDGDKIVTSNISSKFLPGILIGYASDITIDDSQLSKSGYIMPVADFTNLFEVLVITETKSDYFKRQQ